MNGCAHPSPGCQRRDDVAVMPDHFRQTDTGMLPEDWETSTVGDEFEMQLGKMLDASKNTGVAKPYVGNRAVQWGRVDTRGLVTVPMTPTDLVRLRLRRGDLLVCEGGEVGRAAIWDEPIPECYYQKALHRLRPKKAYDTRLLMYFLQFWSSAGHLDNYVAQTSIAHLPKDRFQLVPLPLPPPPEQRAIAAALTDVDELIGALDKLIAKKRHIKLATMQQLLTGRTRLPGFGGTWAHTTAGQIGGFPQDWRVERVADLFDVSAGGDFDKTRSQQTRDEQHPFPVYSNAVETFGLHCYCSYSDQAADSITVTARGTLGVANYRNHAYTAIGRAIVLQPKVEMDGRFFTEFINQRVVFAVESTGVPQLTAPQISKHTLPVPRPSEQCAISDVLADMDAEITALERRRNKTKAIKQGMMQSLLTGRVRLIGSGGAA